MSGARAGGGLLVGLLGPVEIGPAAGALAPVSQPRVRLLLGLLAVTAGRVVSADALVDGMWGEEWSPRRELNLHGQVSALRRRLEQIEPGQGGARLVRVGAGYRLALGPDELDVEAFRALAARGRAAARDGNVEQARELFGAALSWWRGAALADAATSCSRLAGEAAQLEETRLSVLEDRIGCDVALGRHAEAVGEVMALAAQFPLRERLAELLITALYRCGRRGEALAAFDATRQVLRDELGLDPGPELLSLQAKVLADDPALAAPGLTSTTSYGGPSAAPGAELGVAPRQLPAGAGFFAGREWELKALDELLGLDDPIMPGPVVISAVAGMAGVGKTALAVHWARRAAGRFPDGQLYVNLRGFDSEGAAVTPEEVTGWFLVALGVPAEQIPADAQARYGLYRSLLATRRVLIVLDNARDAAQVRPLLPGSPACLVVVTSRSSLAGLVAAEGARPLRLAPMNEEDAARLLAARLGPDRLAAEPAAVTDLIVKCAGLPLALAVMAARAAADPGLPLSALADQLAEHADAGPTSGEGRVRLEALETGDPATSLRELLSWSRRQLSVPATTMFALLGVHCGPDITVPAAASLAGIPATDAGRALAELAHASLVAEHRPGRYVMHDLVRGYAAEHALWALGEADVLDAIGRSLDHYLHSMVISSDTPRPVPPAPPGPGVVPERLADERRVDWNRAEHEVLLQAIAQAAAVGMITKAWQIFECQTWFLGGQGYWADCEAAGHAILAAAAAADDQDALGWTHMIIGRYGTLIGATDEDRAHLFQAMDHFRKAGDFTGQAWTSLNACRAANTRGDFAEASTLGEQSLHLFRRVGEQAGEMWTLYALGMSHARQGNYELAREYAEQALKAATAADDPTSLALAWSVLGQVHAGVGDQQQAVRCYRQAAALGRRWKTPMARRFQVDIFVGFGEALMAAGDMRAAREAWLQARQILDDLRLPDNHGVGARLENLTPPGTPA